MTTPTQGGKPYTGNQQFAGNGTLQSCAKCARHMPVGQLSIDPRFFRLKTCGPCKGVK
jgi:hypothetical protein